MGGRGGRGRMGPNMEAMRATMELAGSRPRRLQLELSDSTFVVIETPGRRVEVPMNGDEVELASAAWPTRGKVQWDDRKPRLERTVSDGGKVLDHYELLAPDRLMITRELDIPTRGKVQVRFVYDREDRSA